MCAGSVPPQAQDAASVTSSYSTPGSTDDSTHEPKACRPRSRRHPRLAPRARPNDIRSACQLATAQPDPPPTPRAPAMAQSQPDPACVTDPCRRKRKAQRVSLPASGRADPPATARIRPRLPGRAGSAFPARTSVSYLGTRPNDIRSACQLADSPAKPPATPPAPQPPSHSQHVCRIRAAAGAGRSECHFELLDERVVEREHVGIRADAEPFGLRRSFGCEEARGAALSPQCGTSGAA